jgi:hypothetical protein
MESADEEIAEKQKSMKLSKYEIEQHTFIVSQNYKLSDAGK